MWDWLSIKWCHLRKVYWYAFKCWLWKRYTTVKPRTLNHQWCDRSELILHMNFEILTQFIERECSPGHIEWYGEYGPKLTVDDCEKFVRDELQELYDWWKYTYPLYEEMDLCIWHYVNKYEPERWNEEVKCCGKIVYKWKLCFLNENDELMHGIWVEAWRKLEENLEADCQEKLHRLINVRQWMWT